jgi:uncharacterized protein
MSMRVLIDIGHPAHVHLFRNAINIMRKRGHQVFVVARKKEVAHQLLNEYGIKFMPGSTFRSGLMRGVELLEWLTIVKRVIKKNGIDIAVSIGSPAAAWAAKLSSIPHIAFNDTEISYDQRALYAPASIRIFTPACLLADYGPKQVRYDGIHDLAYLRPEYFKPDKAVKGELGLGENESYVIIRFVSWDATHDWIQQKTGSAIKREIIQTALKNHRVFISAEGRLPQDIEGMRLKISPHRLHDAMAFAAAVIGDGATTATEAAVLGVPSLYIATPKFINRLGCIQFLSREYKLLDTMEIRDFCSKNLERFLSSPRLEERARERKRLLANTIDVATYIAHRCEQFARK